MSDVSFDLIGIFRAIFRKKTFIICVTLAAMVISIIFCALQEKRYTSKTSFIVKNPLLIDRNYVFRNTSYEHRDFFAIPDDVDHVQTIAKNDGVIWHLIEKFDLAKAYGMEADDRLVKKVRGNFKAVMEDTKNIELFCTDKDPKRAAAMATEARNYLEHTFINYFLATNKDITDALKEKSAGLKDSVAKLDQEIATLRAAGNSYNQLLPSRGNTIVAANAGSAQSAGALEQLQEITVQKDRMLADLASYRSLINEYEVMANKNIHIFYVVGDAFVPSVASHPKTLIIVGASTLAALFFACILVLFTAFYSSVMRADNRNPQAA